MRKLVALIAFLIWTLPTHGQASIYNYAADDFGGLLSVSCAGHPHKQNIISASQASGTPSLQTVVVANNYYAVNETMIIAGTGTAMDWTYPSTPNPYDSTSYIQTITGTGPYTLTLVAFNNNTVGTVTSTGLSVPACATRSQIIMESIQPI